MNKDVYNEIKKLANRNLNDFSDQIELYTEGTGEGSKSCYSVYETLGITELDWKLIDLYQYKGRFLRVYADSFLKDAARACIKSKYPDGERGRVPNPQGRSPEYFEIDCLVEKLAHTIAWQEAPADEDYAAKEAARVQALSAEGYVPVRVVFYSPQQVEEVKAQEEIEALYKKVGGKYYCGDRAWAYLKEYTGIDLLEMIEAIVKSRE